MDYLLTISDRHAFPGVAFFLAPSAQRFGLPLFCVDIGLTDAQRDWCGANGVHVLPEPAGINRAPPQWQYWAKAAGIASGMISGGTALYLDTDCLLLESPAPLFDAARRDGLIAVSGLQAARNSPLLQWRFPSGAPIGPWPNGGVIGVDCRGGPGGAAEVMAAWLTMSRIGAAEAPHGAGRLLAWHDEGALAWALEKTGKTRLVHDRPAWNAPHRLNFTVSPEVFFGNVTHRPGNVVAHYAGSPKPWARWRDCTCV